MLLLKCTEVRAKEIEEMNRLEFRNSQNILQRLLLEGHECVERSKALFLESFAVAPQAARQNAHAPLSWRVARYERAGGRLRGPPAQQHRTESFVPAQGRLIGHVGLGSSAAAERRVPYQSALFMVAVRGLWVGRQRRVAPGEPPLVDRKERASLGSSRATHAAEELGACGPIRPGAFSGWTSEWRRDCAPCHAVCDDSRPSMGFGIDSAT
ncbi:hypothetical protein MRX96_016575 [Rhipicephalus microplus]